MTDLDNPAIYERLDPSDMRGRIREFPEQCRRAWRQALALQLPPDYSTVQRVAVLGMGGSAIGGDLLGSLAAARSRVPVSVCRDYDLPHPLDDSTLVVASSYSGMTEETLSAFSQALKTPARKLVMTTGGRIAEMAEENGVPVFHIDYKSQPRAALAHSFFPLLAVCQNLGLIGDLSSDVEETVQALDDLETALAETVPSSGNRAKQMASDLHGKIAVIYGAGILSPVARRWKTQINENSKAWAFNETLPEMNHNAVVGYEFPAELARSVFAVVLRSPRLHPRTLVRCEAVAEVLARAGVEHRTVDGSGESDLSQMMSLVVLGDWISYYLAILNGTDPTPVAAIDYLKKRLADA